MSTNCIIKDDLKLFRSFITDIGQKDLAILFYKCYLLR
jgi:hypothetical protein